VQRLPLAVPSRIMLRRPDWLTVLCMTGLATGCGRVTLPAETDANDGVTPAIDAGPLPPPSGADAGPVQPPSDAAPPPPLDPSLIAWYPLDSAGNGQSLDFSGNGHHAACAPDPTVCPAIVDGQVGKAMDFDEVTHLRVEGGDGFFDTTQGFTVAGWFWLEPPFYSAPLSKMLGTGSGNSWQFEYSDTGVPAFTTSNATDKRVDYDGSTAVQPQAWVHLAGTWDGTTKRFYVNGALRYEIPFVVGWDASDIVIGGDENDGASALMFGGRIDDVRIYNRALADDEIAALAQAL
jgi:hypothetical protein